MNMPDCHYFRLGCCRASYLCLGCRYQHEPGTAPDGCLYALLNLSNRTNLAGQCDLSDRNSGRARTAFVERPGNGQSGCQIGCWLNDSHSTKCGGVHILIAKPQTAMFLKDCYEHC